MSDFLRILNPHERHNRPDPLRCFATTWLWALRLTKPAHPSFGRQPLTRYSPHMASDAAPKTAPKLWKPHPDDDADIAEAMDAANRGDLLSPEASEAFVRWLEGAGDDSWRAELE